MLVIEIWRTNSVSSVVKWLSHDSKSWRFVLVIICLILTFKTSFVPRNALRKRDWRESGLRFCNIDSVVTLTVLSRWQCCWFTTNITTLFCFLKARWNVRCFSRINTIDGLSLEKDNQVFFPFVSNSIIRSSPAWERTSFVFLWPHACNRSPR